MAMTREQYRSMRQTEMARERLLRRRKALTQSATGAPSQGMAALSGANPAEAKAIQAQTQAQPFGGMSANQMQGAALGVGAIGASLQSASGGEGTGAVVGSTLSGAATGASIGTMVAPGIGTAIGAGAGAAAGLVKGVAGSKSKRKARRRAAMARKWENISAIRQREGAQKQAALTNIMEGLRSAYLR